MTDKLSEELRKLADQYEASDEFGYAKLFYKMLRRAADELDRSARLISDQRGALDEKQDIDAAVAETVARQESSAISAECLRLQAALVKANDRSLRWEDKVHQYGREVEAVKELCEARIAELTTERDSLKRCWDETEEIQRRVGLDHLAAVKRAEKAEARIARLEREFAIRGFCLKCFRYVNAPDCDCPREEQEPAPSEASPSKGPPEI